MEEDERREDVIVGGSGASAVARLRASRPVEDLKSMDDALANLQRWKEANIGLGKILEEAEKELGREESEKEERKGDFLDEETVGDDRAYREAGLSGISVESMTKKIAAERRAFELSRLAAESRAPLSKAARAKLERLARGELVPPDPPSPKRESDVKGWELRMEEGAEVPEEADESVQAIAKSLMADRLRELGISFSDLHEEEGTEEEERGEGRGEEEEEEGGEEG